MDKISIITPSYNSNLYIKETYESIISQTYENWEWIVTDDCSSDKSYETLKKISNKDHRVRIFRNSKNNGAAFSRNCSISHSKAEYLAFLDIDDLWLPDKLTTQISYMKSKDINFSFTAYELIDIFGEPLNRVWDYGHKNSISYNDMLKKKAIIGCSTVMLKKNAFEDFMMPDIRTGQDYALWLKLLKTEHRAYPINEILTKYRIVPGSISRNKIKKAIQQWEIYRSIEKLSMTKSIECFIHYALRAIFRE